MSYTVSTYGFKATSMAKHLTIDELTKLMEEVRADVSCQNPPESFSLFNDKGERRLENIGWAIYYKQKECV